MFSNTIITTAAKIQTLPHLPNSLNIRFVFILVDCETSYNNFNKSLSCPLPGTNQYWCHEESWS